ncbi:MAG: nucleotidyltransferase domain-containing protein [Leptospiraceae bacterium]|nr:nucleotidyltransferase domain-containing protein [Leptospiraceae bacterium]
MELTKDPILKKLIASIRNELGNNLSKIILFGSRAKNNHEKDSDYDLLILVNKNLPSIKKI